MAGMEPLLGELLSTGLVFLDAEGRILGANGAAEALFGRPRRALTGEAAAQYLPDAQTSLEALARGRMTGPVSTETMLRLGPSGPEPEHAVRATFMRVEAGLEALPAGTVFLLELVDAEDFYRTERLRIEAELARANRELLRNLAHEIKNPLGGIRGAAQILEADLEGEDARECTGIIISEADRLAGLVDRLLLPYRSAPAERSPLNVHEVLEYVRGLIEREFTVSIERDYDISAPAAAADRGRMVQVFLNLARNAAEALAGRPDGRIVLSTRIVRDVFLGGARTRRALRVEVIDNGPGVPEEIRDRIFFPLVTGRPEGSGIGLSIVKTFVEEAGGAIELESAPGRTVFRTLLPFYDAAEEANR